MKVRVLVRYGNGRTGYDDWESKYQTVGQAGELVITDADGTWLATYAPDGWITVQLVTK